MDAKNWPTEYVISTSSNWVETVPRPKEGDCHPSVLARRQEQWDAAHARQQKIVTRSAEIVAEREEKLRASQERQAAESDAREQKKRGELEETLRRRFVAAGGSAAEWENPKEQIVAEHVKAQALAGHDPGREAQAALYRNF
jgi:hypothetical protein